MNKEPTMLKLQTQKMAARIKLKALRIRKWAMLNPLYGELVSLQLDKQHIDYVAKYGRYDNFEAWFIMVRRGSLARQMRERLEVEKAVLKDRWEKGEITRKVYHRILREHRNYETETVEQLEKRERAERTYWLTQFRPNYCRTCNGWGHVGEGDSCPACIDNGLCPYCFRYLKKKETNCHRQDCRWMKGDPGVEWEFTKKGIYEYEKPTRRNTGNQPDEKE